MALNIERFDEVATRILRHLYERFPNPAHPDPTCIGLIEEKVDYVDGDLAVSADWHDLNNEVRSVLQWLIEEGFVLHRNHQIGPKNIITAKGFEALMKLDHYYTPPRFFGM